MRKRRLEPNEQIKSGDVWLNSGGCLVTVISFSEPFGITVAEWGYIPVWRGESELAEKDSEGSPEIPDGWFRLAMGVTLLTGDRAARADGSWGVLGDVEGAAPVLPGEVVIRKEETQEPPARRVPHICGPEAQNPDGSPATLLRGPDFALRFDVQWED